MIRIIIGIIIGVALATSVAQADDKANTVTPRRVREFSGGCTRQSWQSLADGVDVDIKAYQAASWVDAKAQSARTWAKLKSLFNTTKTTK